MATPPLAGVGVAPVVEALPFVTPQPVGIHGETKDLAWKATK